MQATRSMGIEKVELALETINRGLHQRNSRKPTGIVQEEARGKVVRAIEHCRAACHQRPDISRGNFRQDGLNLNQWIVRFKAGRRGSHFGYTDIIGGKQNLAVEIRYFYQAGIDQDQTTDT